MDFKMADTFERRVFCDTILLKYHGIREAAENDPPVIARPLQLFLLLKLKESDHLS